MTGREKERRIKLDDLENLAPSPLSLTLIVHPSGKSSGCDSIYYAGTRFLIEVASKY